MRERKLKELRICNLGNRVGFVIFVLSFINMKILLLLLFITGRIYSQEEKETILIPGKGIILFNDTILINIESPESLLLKIDTTNYESNIFYGSGTACGIISFTDSVTGKTTTKDASWSTSYCNIIWDWSIEFEFEGSTKEDLILTKIKIFYPHLAKTINGLKTGDDYKGIFHKYENTNGSYNCGDKGYFYCYSNYGISFRVKPYKEKPNPEMFEKILGFEIYKKIE